MEALIFMAIAPPLRALSSPACRLLRIDHCEGEDGSRIRRRIRSDETSRIRNPLRGRWSAGPSGSMMASPGPHSATRKGTYGLGDGVEEDLAAGTAAARGGQQGSLTSFGRLAALSLDALSSVPYGPQAIVLV